jgi:hypothetical protein
MTPAQKIIDRLRTLTDRAGIRLSAAPAASQMWLQESSHLPSELVGILSHSWPSEDISLGVYELWSLDHLSESERAKIAFKGGFFLIGSAGNGDLLVVRRQPVPIDECEVGLISHEKLWEKGSYLESIYVPICRGFMVLLNGADLENGLPPDFYEARNRNNA